MIDHFKALIYYSDTLNLVDVYFTIEISYR